MNDEPERRLPAIATGGAVRAIIPQSFEEVWRIANAVVISGINPKGLDTAEKCTVVIMHGLEVGLSPMNALWSIALINGRPCLYGDGPLGLVQGSGKLETIKEVLTGDGDARVATCTVKRRGDPEPKVGRFSVHDAKTAKLWGKAGPWQEYPQRMLQFRARAWALRDGFADVLKGLAIAEEWRDVEHDSNEQPRLAPPTPPTPPVKGTNTFKRDRPFGGALDPKPPQPPKPEPKPELDLERAETEQEVTFEETLSPGELLSELDDSLSTAKTVDEIEEIWNDYDLEAQLQSMRQGEEFIGVSLGIKRRHLKRVSP
jgi:hypothetical protein